MGIAFLLHLFAKKLYKDEAISQTIDVLSRINDVLKLEESLSRLIGDGLIINSSCIDRASIKRYESNSTFKRKKKKKKIIFFCTSIKFPSYFCIAPRTILYDYTRRAMNTDERFFFSQLRHRAIREEHKSIETRPLFANRSTRTVTAKRRIVYRGVESVWKTTKERAIDTPIKSVATPSLLPSRHSFIPFLPFEIHTRHDSVREEDSPDTVALFNRSSNKL